MQFYKMKKSLLFLMLAAMTSLTAMAQSKVNVSGTVIEDETKEAVISATVRILSLPDSSMVGGAASGVDGSFTIKDIKKGKYVLKVTYIGYQDHEMPLDLTKSGNKNHNIGYITMVSDAKLLKEAKVTANAAQVQVSGDSIVYNASAYRVAEGSALQDLVKKLPGAEVDDDGNIKINGKSVKKILMNGKEFFLNDTKVAMENIPTDIIDRIKSYERKSDYSRVTGIDDGEEETVLDLTVKKGMNSGWTANLNLGVGTKERYDNRLYARRSLENAAYTLIGGLNNTGSRGFGGGGGRGGWGGGGNGLRTDKNAAFNFALAATEKLEMGGNIRFRYNGNDTRSESNTQNFVSPTGAFTNAASTNLSSNSGVNMDLRLEWKPDSMTNIIFRPSGNYSRNRGYSNSANATFNENVYDYSDKFNGSIFDNIDKLNDLVENLVVNSNFSRQQTYSNNKGLNGELQVNRRLNNEGRNITFRATGNISGSESKQLSASNIKYYAADRDPNVNNRFYNTPGRSRNYSLQLSYSEPIAYKTYLQFSYRYNFGYSRNDRQAFTFDPVAYNDIFESLNKFRYNIDGAIDWLLSRGDVMKDASMDDDANRLSQYSEYHNYNHTINASFRKVGEKYNFTFGFDFMPQNTTLDYKYMGKQYDTVKRHVFNYAPNLDFRYDFDKQTNFRLNYRSNTSQPNMTNLLDITDDSNPLNITKGNPGLKPSLNHNLRLNFNSFEAEHQRSIFSWMGASLTQNSIANRVSYDASTGVRTTKPENINGNWNGYAGFGFNTALDANKYFTIRNMTNFGYNHQLSYLDPTQYEEDKSSTNSFNISDGLGFSFRKDWFEMSINGNVNHQRSRNNVMTSNNLNTWTFSYGTELNLIFENGFSISTDLSQSSRRGFSSASMNTNELLWNAQISKSFLKGNALTITAQWNDILHNRSNISRAIDAMRSSDTHYNSIYSYGMIRAIYKLNIFGGKSGAHQGPGGPGGFGGFGGRPGGFVGGRPM